MTYAYILVWLHNKMHFARDSLFRSVQYVNECTHHLKLACKMLRIDLHTIKRSANWIGYILRRNCLLQHTIEGKIEGRIEVTERQGRRCKHLLDDCKEKTGYWKLKEEALDHTMWRTHFGKAYVPVVRLQNQ
jgi:hypothetical protein